MILRYLRRRRRERDRIVESFLGDCYDPNPKPFVLLSLRKHHRSFGEWCSQTVPSLLGIAFISVLLYSALVFLMGSEFHYPSFYVR